MALSTDFVVDLTGQDYHLDNRNLLHDLQTNEVIAYVGGVQEKGLRGLQVTNQLGDKTSSFQHIYGLTSQPLLREDGMLVGGTIAEVLAEPELVDWLHTTLPNEMSRLQIYSILAQLYYACSLLTELGWSVGEALSGIKIRSVDPNSTVPFFTGFIKTYGVIPVIYNLEAITQDEEPYPKDVIGYILDIVNITPHWRSGNFSTFFSVYQNEDMTYGLGWNNLIGEEIWTQYSCPGNVCSANLGPGDYNPLVDLFTSSDGKVSVENHATLAYERDVWLMQSTTLPLPDFVQPYAQAIQGHLAETYPDDQVFATNINVSPQLISEYLNISRIQDLFFNISDELHLLLGSRYGGLRNFVLSDILSGNTTNNEIYLRSDRILPQLEAGGVVSFETITVTDYNPETQVFAVERQDNGDRLSLNYDDLLRYLETTEDILPYTDELLQRKNIAVINGIVQYTNDEKGQLFPLDTSRLYVRDHNNILAQLLNNTQDMLSMALAHLYGELT